MWKLWFGKFSIDEFLLKCIFDELKMYLRRQRQMLLNPPQCFQWLNTHRKHCDVPTPTVFRFLERQIRTQRPKAVIFRWPVTVSTSLPHADFIPARSRWCGGHGAPHHAESQSCCSCCMELTIHSLFVASVVWLITNLSCCFFSWQLKLIHKTN